MTPKSYKISEAVALVAKHGMTDLCINYDAQKDNRLVKVCQNWWPNGTEVAEFRLMRGKYKGNVVGFALRPKQEK